MRTTQLMVVALLCLTAGCGLHARMERMEDQMVRIDKMLVDDPAAHHAELLTATDRLQRHAEKSAERKPHTDHLPKADRAAFVAAYREAMDVLIDEIKLMGEAILEHRYTDANQHFDALRKMEYSGHERYRDVGEH